MARPGEYSRVHRSRPGNVDKFNKVIGKKLKMFRVNKGLSQAEVADRMGVSQVTVCRMECGHDNISLSRVDSFLRAVGVNFIWEFPSPD